MERKGSIATKFGTMKYAVMGEGEEFAVMLQGWATKRELYGGVVSSLAEKYTVIFPMFLGFGESEEPSEALCVSDYAEAVNLLLTELGVKKARFFCHPFGGRVFFKLNAMEDRFTEPSDVLLCDVAGVLPKKSLWKRLRIRIYKLGKKLLDTKIMRFFFPDALETLRSGSGSADYNSASPVMRGTLVRTVNEDLRHLFGLVGSSTLILWGKSDDAVPLSDAYIIDAAIKDSAVIVFENSGHFPFITERAKFDAVLRSFFGI